MTNKVLAAAIATACGVVGLWACVSDTPGSDEGQGDAAGSDGTAADGAGGGDDGGNVGAEGGDGASLVCDAGFTTCGTPAACVDLGADPKNCGTCGHDCLAGRCQAGACLPRAIYNANAPDAATGSVSTIAVDGTSLYWIVPRIPNPGDNLLPLDCTIYRCPLTGNCTVPAAVWTEHVMDQLLYVPATPGYVYFTDSQNDAILRFSTAGTDAGTGLSSCAGGASPCVVTGAPHSYVMTSDGTSLYWGTNYVNNSSFGVWRSPIASPSPVKLGPANIASSVTAIALDPDDTTHAYTYTADHEGNIHGFANSETNVDPETLATAQGAPGGIVVAYHKVFWTAPAAGKIVTQFACNNSGCKTPPTFPATDFLTGRASPEAIAADATNVYWTEGGKIFTCPLPGCLGGTAVKIEEQTSHIDVLLVDATSITFGDDQGAVWRLAK